MIRPSAAALQNQCEAFNAACPVGHPVVVRMDCGDRVSTVTRSAAEVLSGHSAVIWLENISGCYLLDRVTPVGQDTFAPPPAPTPKPPLK